jgi:hypothetical protein
MSQEDTALASLDTRRAVQTASGAIAPGTEPHSGLSQHTNRHCCIGGDCSAAARLSA